MSDESADARGHRFVFTVQLTGEGGGEPFDLQPQVVRAYSLSAAIEQLARIPFPDWFEDETEER